MISKIDPALFKMVVLLTQRLREYRQDGNTILANLTQKRKTQCLYCLCVLIFATDSNCSAPMHILENAISGKRWFKRTNKDNESCWGSSIK